jgi:hypothetical protein
LLFRASQNNRLNKRLFLYGGLELELIIANKAVF